MVRVVRGIGVVCEGYREEG
ncbi:hypothetical protein A2U01_0059468, partial [Trifolium medium]|nr:hypothetical protein [Trifolium medium]